MENAVIRRERLEYDGFSFKQIETLQHKRLFKRKNGSLFLKSVRCHLKVAKYGTFFSVLSIKLQHES